VSIDDLVAAATVGARHRSVDWGTVPAVLQPISLDGDPALALLDAATLLTCARRTTTAVGRPGPAAGPEPEQLPVISDQVRQVLTRLQEHRGPLVEALDVIHAGRHRLPPDLVPILLDDNRPDVVEATRRVGGEIGRWLMSKNPRWSVVVVDPADPAGWEHGSQAQRIEWFRRYRQTDPAAAGELLRTEIDGESAAARVLFLSVLGEGLVPEDEALLVRLLDDRSRTVAAAALELLVRLPSSALRRDMEEIVGRHLEVHRGLLRTSVTIGRPAPDEFGPWPRGDGGLEVALSRVDPAEWPGLVGGDLLGQVRRDQESLRPMHSAILQAAITFRHAELAAVLADQEVARMDPRKPTAVNRDLWAVLDPDAGARLVQRLWDSRVRLDVTVDALTAIPTPWARELSLALPARLVAAAGTAGVSLKNLWNLWSSSVAPADCSAAAGAARAATAAAAAANQDRTHLRAAGPAITVVALRSAFVDAFHPSGDTR